MQAQQYAAPLPPNYYTPVQAVHPSLSDQYLAPEDAQNITNSFSRGSSFTYPHQEYRYLLDRGELASRLCASSLVDSTLDATGLGFAGNHSSNATFVAPEDIAPYQTWDWTGVSNGEIIAPAPVYAALPESDYFGIKSSANLASTARSPAAQLPTPAAMAILLNPNGRSEEDPSQIGYDIPPGSAFVANHASAPARDNRLVEPVLATQEGISESLSREKKHACTMCHKRFDRPSTLRKHLLVHTGEKAFVCDTCGRRFGVASNLNRHVKRCILKPVNTPSPSHRSSLDSPAAAADSPAVSIVVSPALSAMPPREISASSSISASGSRSGKRPRAPVSPTTGSSTSSGASDQSQAPSITSKAKPPGQKRRRRAPSPSQWVPATLQNFNLLSDDSYRVTSVPLPPVRRNPPKEERDSWDENVGHAPYHPCGWSGVLPGPGLGHGLGLGGKDVRNLNLGGRGGFMLGRVLVF